MAITVLMLLTIVVSELSYVARVRYIIANHQRDEAQAYWLARSGINIYVLVLAADRQLGKNINLAEMGFGTQATLWQEIHTISSGIMRMLLGSGSSGLDEEDIAAFQQTGQISDEIVAQSREGTSVFSDRNFLDFEGDFHANVTDNESRLDVNQLGEEEGPIQDSPTAQLIYALMSGEQNDEWFQDRNIERWELIGNLRDWVDADNVISSGSGGYEDDLYNALEPPYLAKNQKFDTLEEIRLVDGWQDEVYEKYGTLLTIWSNGNFNLNSISPEQHAFLIAYASGTGIDPEQIEISCVQMENPLSWIHGAQFATAEAYATLIETNCGIEIDHSKLVNITNTSRVFTVTSTGFVGTSTVEIQAVLDYTDRSAGETVYWRVR